MHVVVTGAGGFVGRTLVQRLLYDVAALSQPLSRLTAIDQYFGEEAAAWRSDARLALLTGDFADPALMEAAMQPAPDVVFHLASVPGSRAEQEPALGLQVNLLAPIALLNRLAKCAAPPRVVFASSVAVYGALPTEGSVTEAATARPALSYGAHKLMTEILLADLSRRGQLDGVSLRLPGIVARPLSPSGHGSAFMSDLIRLLLARQPYQCPVSAAAQAWWMSLPCCLDNLLHAATMATAGLPQDRTVQLPVLTHTVSDLIKAIEAQTGKPADVTFSPNERIEALFGRMPQLVTPHARQLGFTDDGSLKNLIQRALSLDVVAPSSPTH